jgi:mannose-1-phosphate guanylyltransferase
MARATIGGKEAAMSWQADRWGVILAGGDGTRLRALTRELSGDDRPKQFCPVLGGRTLLDETRRRIARTIAPGQIMVVVTRHHERYYGPALADLPADRVVVQPANRGTATAILATLVRLARRAPAAAAAIFPSDHYVSDDAGFMKHVDDAFETATTRPELTVLLGIPPDRPETEYGWIEPAAPLAGLGRLSGAAYAVSRFWEKPTLAVAERLRARGGLWNAFVVVGRVSSLLSLVRVATPALYQAFAAAEGEPGTGARPGDLDQRYARLAPIDFSRQVLSVQPARLAVLPVQGVEWNDLGDPRRVRETRECARRRTAGSQPYAVAHA